MAPEVCQVSQVYKDLRVNTRTHPTDRLKIVGLLAHTVLDKCNLLQTQYGKGSTFESLCYVRCLKARKVMKV